MEEQQQFQDTEVGMSSSEALEAAPSPEVAPVAEESATSSTGEIDYANVSMGELIDSVLANFDEEEDDDDDDSSSYSESSESVEHIELDEDDDSTANDLDDMFSSL